MISRYLLIVLTIGVGLYRASQGAWLAASGLFAMGAGLIVLKLAERRPPLRRVAYLCFAATALTILIILVQGRQ
jgi:hypothetical protein